jgi:uncharacterized repeat protein (TIGR01451 family)
MRKQLGFITSLALLVVTAALWMGCSYFDRSDSNPTPEVICRNTPVIAQGPDQPQTMNYKRPIRMDIDTEQDSRISKDSDIPSYPVSQKDTLSVCPCPTNELCPPDCPRPSCKPCKPVNCCPCEPCLPVCPRPTNELCPPDCPRPSCKPVNCCPCEPCLPVCPRPIDGSCPPDCPRPSCKPVNCCPCEPCLPVCPRPIDGSCPPDCPPASCGPCKPVNCCPCEPCPPVCPPSIDGSCPPDCPGPTCEPCNPMDFQASFEPSPVNICEPVCQPVLCPPSCQPRLRCHYPSTNQLCCNDRIIITARNPNMCLLGDEYPLEFDIKACEDVCDVIVTTHLPDGVSFIRSIPEARVECRRVIWNIGSMRKGECRLAKAWLRCECEGEVCACFCATATPVKFCSLLCAKPVLSCHKCGPDEVRPGDSIQYSITVTNRGSCIAEDVVVTDQVPEGLSHNSCMRTLTYRLGNLEPCQTKKINLCLTAEKRGRICNTAVVTACNADSVCCQWYTNVLLECLELAKDGPREMTIGKIADYAISVFNSGDKPLTDIIVTDTAPEMTSVVAAPGALINGRQAVWRLPQLMPGERLCFAPSLTTCTPGCFTNHVTVATCQGCYAEADFTTRWRGRPALNVQICDTEDPICIGDTTSYCITVVNQGSEADSNVVVTLQFPPEMIPLSATGDIQGCVCGQTVTFIPAPTLLPHSCLRYRVDARAAASGDARINVSVTSDSIQMPITQQESTIVN